MGNKISHIAPYIWMTRLVPPTIHTIEDIPEAWRLFSFWKCWKVFPGDCCCELLPVLSENVAWAANIECKARTPGAWGRGEPLEPPELEADKTWINHGLDWSMTGDAIVVNESTMWPGAVQEMPGRLLMFRRCVIVMSGPGGRVTRRHGHNIHIHPELWGEVTERRSFKMWSNLLKYL